MARRRAPVWLMGMGNATFGLAGGFLVVPLPLMLARQGHSQAEIAAVSAVCFAPGAWVFLLGPVLDVLLSRRAWSAVFAVLSGVLMGAGVWMRADLRMLETAIMLSYACAVMSSNALGGWYAGIATEGGAMDRKRLSAWTQVAVFLGNGAMAFLATEGLVHLPRAAGALLLGVLTAAPALVFPWVPMPHAADVRLDSAAQQLADGFRALFAALGGLLRQRDVWMTLALFLLPTGSFALSNQLTGAVAVFHVSDEYVARVTAIALSVVGGCACLLLPLCARRVRVLPFYLIVGAAGSFFTLAMLLLPVAPWAYALAFLGENFVQALSFTTAVAVCFERIGQNNPLAATEFSLLTSATVLPILYMGLVDGHVYARAGLPHGLHGMYLVDGGLSLIACIVMAIVMLRRSAPGTDAQVH